MTEVKELLKDKNVRFLLSLTGPFAMGCFHLYASMHQFSWRVFNYALFSFLIVLIRILIEILDRKRGGRYLYLTGTLSFLILCIPMAAAMVMTIQEGRRPVYLFFWMIYAYAAYGFGKLIYALIQRHKRRREEDPKQYVLSCLSLVSALYTIDMLEAALINTFTEGDLSSMLNIQFITQAVILIITVIMAFILLKKHRKAGKKSSMVE